MKKIHIVLAALVLLAMSFTFAGCGGDQETADSAAPASNQSGYIDVDSVDGENSGDYDKYNETQATTGSGTGAATTDTQSNDTTEDSTSSSASADKPTNNVTDEYQTTPVPEGKPQPVEPQEATVDDTEIWHCTFYIECSKILDNLESFNQDKVSVLPTDGVIYAKKTVAFEKGQSVFDILQSETRANGIHLEFTDTPGYNSAYIEGIGNLYEMDCGPLSGWIYSVNGWFPNYGCSRYQVQDGDTVEFHYTCDSGSDFGQDSMNR